MIRATAASSARLQARDKNVGSPIAAADGAGIPTPARAVVGVPPYFEAAHPVQIPETLYGHLAELERIENGPQGAKGSFAPEHFARCNALHLRRAVTRNRLA